MDSHRVAINDSFIDRVIGAKNTSIYNFRVESPVAESCGTFGWAACRACFAGMRSVKECLAVLFCLRPDERLEVHFYESRTSTDRLGQLTIPLLPECGRDSENPKTDKESRIEDSGDSRQPVVRIFWNDISLKFEPLSPVTATREQEQEKEQEKGKEKEQPSMAYQSISEYNSDLSSSESEEPL